MPFAKLIPLTVMLSVDEESTQRDEACVRLALADTAGNVRRNLDALKMIPLAMAFTDDGFAIDGQSIRVASRDGLQTLYADAEDALERYKDFDLVKAILERGEAKLLWFRSRAIDADTVNANGDYFSTEELLREVLYNGKKVPAYKTFEGVPIYTNHENNDITKAKGMVVYAEWDPKDKCVYTVAFVDEEAYPDIARGVRMGYMHDVSMGCKVEYGVCSVCEKKAYNEKQYCEHMSRYKGKIYPGNGKKAFEYNFGLQFIELSIVGDGAFDRCEIKELYDQEEVLSKFEDTKKAATRILNRAVTYAPSISTKDPGSFDFLSTLSAASAMASMTLKLASDETLVRRMANTWAVAPEGLVALAQNAGTLVGGKALAQPGPNGNTTVDKILQFLGIDAKSGLNILDMLNLALNFMEVGVLNLFARKDNVDLTHVSKISKAMSDLQSTMQDMIDDGIDVAASQGGGGASGAGVLLNQNSGVQKQEEASPQGGQAADYQPHASGIGRMMGPNMAQLGAGMGPGQAAQPQGAPGRTSSSDLPPLRWAGPTKRGRVVVASRNDKAPENTTYKLDRFADSLVAIAECVGRDAVTRPTIRAAKDTQPVKRGAPAEGRHSVGGQQQMNFLKQMADSLRQRKGDLMRHITEFEDDAQKHKVALASDGDIKGYVNGRIASGWSPTLTTAQIDAIENEQLQPVGQALLGDLKAWARTAQLKADEAYPQPESIVDEDKEVALTPKREDLDQDIKERELDQAGDYKRKHNVNDIKERALDDESYYSDRKGEPKQELKEVTLDEDAGLYGRKGTDDDVKEHLLDDVRLGDPTETIENRLDAVRARTANVDARALVRTVMAAIADAAVSARVTPEETFTAALKLAERNDKVDIIALASFGTKTREVKAKRLAFYNNVAPTLNTENALIHELGKAVGAFTAADISDALGVIAINQESSFHKVAALAKAKIVESKVAPSDQTAGPNRKDILTAALFVESGDSLIDRKHMNKALFAMADATEECLTHPYEAVEFLEDYSNDIYALAQDIEICRTAAVKESRQKKQLRALYYNMQKTASADELGNELISALADRADESGASSLQIAAAALKIASKPSVAEDMIHNVISSRTAAATVTEESSMTKTLRCTLADLGNIDPKDPSFLDSFKGAAQGLFQKAGFEMVNFTNLSVGEMGDVTADVTSRVSKTVKVDGDGGGPDLQASDSGMDTPPQPPHALDSATSGGDMGGGDMGNGSGIKVEGDTISTPSADALAKAAAAAGVSLFIKTAQGMPPMNSGGGAGPDPMGGAAPAGGDAGMGSLTLPSETGADGTAPAEDPGDTDAMSEPGNKKPWGSVCPVCGSADVDIANGEGNCKSCGSQLKYTFEVQVMPSNDDDKSGTASGGEEGPELNEDTGLGAATAPAPTPDMGGGAGGGMPGGGGGAPAGANILASVTWLTDSTPFVKMAAARSDEDRDMLRISELKLPVGYVCPSCGNRDVESLTKLASQTFCDECGSIAVSKVTSAKDPRKLKNSIIWIAYAG